MSTEHDVNMVSIMSPLLKSNIVIPSDTDKNIFSELAHIVRENFSPVLYDQNKMII